MRADPRQFWLLVLLSVLLGSLGFYALREGKEILRFPGPQGALESNIGGNDWVVWADGPSGVYASWVHPLIKTNPLLKNNYVREGDSLTGIEYQPIYRAEAVNQIIHHASPGTIFSFQVLRQNTLSLIPTPESFLLVTSYQPRFSFSETSALWSLSPWIYAAGTLLALLSLLILFPILQPQWWNNFPVFLVLGLGLLIFSSLMVHHVYLLVRTEYVQAGFEKLFIFGMTGLLLGYSLVTVYGRLRGAVRAMILLPLGIGLFFYYHFGQLVFWGPFYLVDELLLGYLYCFFLAHLGFSLLLSAQEKWRLRSRQDKAFHILALLYTGILFVVYLDEVLGYSLLPGPGSYSRFFALGAVFIPLINFAASQMKFGKVRVVLGRSLQYLVFGLTTLGFFLAIHQVFAWLGVSFRYQSVLEVALLIVIMTLVRSIYKGYERGLRDYFVLSQDKKREAIEQFITRIPQFTSSERLVEALDGAVRDFFETDRLGINITGEPRVGMGAGPDPEGLNRVYQLLSEPDEFWSKSKQLHDYLLPQAEESLLRESPFVLAVPISVNEKVNGLLLLGAKRRGVYNLEDLEILFRITQQTRLTLGVLYLLEREKLLMQKTYEANLTALRSQINPHFLFNTLNTISSLIHDAPDEAEEAVEKLAFIFRYTLKHSSQNFVALKDELSLIRTYLEIEKIRFGDRLEVKYEIEPGLEETPLPAFVMQTIVENCIKHGVARIVGQGIVSLEVSRQQHENEPEFMVAKIEDNGPGIDLSRIHTSTGLNNITTRLEQIYELKNLLYFENTGSGTLVTIKIPIEKT